eukprot:symbB.v1.2.040345.t1/scaffold7158.1/size12989/1
MPFRVWSAGRYEKTNPENVAPKSRWNRDRIRSSAREAKRRAQEAFDNMPEEEEILIEEADRNFEEQMRENEERQRRQEQEKTQGEETSLAEEVPEESKEEEQAQEEDLSMFERDLTLPDEGAMCIDTKIHAAKYLMVQLMNRINKDMKTFWKFNIATDRKGKLANWEKGFRPDLTGKDYPVKEIDPMTGEPKALSELEYIQRIRSIKSYEKLLEKGGGHMTARAYAVHKLIHKIRWAIYRIGMDQNDLSNMIEHNRQQTLLQKTRRDYLGGTAEIVEKVVEKVLIQNDPSYTTMCKILKLVSGCETFSFLTKMQSENTHLSIDMEALIGDPINTVVDQETVLLLYQYGFTQLYGASAKYLSNMIDGRANLSRQIVEFEDYRKSVPQLQFTAPDEATHDQADLGSGSRPSEAARDVGSSKKTAKVFGAGGVKYDLPESERAPEKPNIDLRPRSERVGASAKAWGSRWKTFVATLPVTAIVAYLFVSRRRRALCAGGDDSEAQVVPSPTERERSVLRRPEGVKALKKCEASIGEQEEFLSTQAEDGSPRTENGHEEKNEADKDVSMGPTPTSAVHGPNLCNLTMSRQSIIHGQWRHTDAGELLLHLSCFISAFSLVACLDGNLIELQKVKKFQQNSFEERSTRSGKLESKILQLSKMLEEFLYCAYLRQASEQRLLAELAAWQRMCTEQSCKPQARILPKTPSKSGLFKFISCVQQPGKDDARATEKLDMDSLPLKDRESQAGMCCYHEWSVLLRYSALEWLLLCAYSIACHRVQHAQQTRVPCIARERSELEAKESLAQAQIAKLQQQLAAERFRSEQLESKVRELEEAVRNKDLPLAKLNGSNGSGMPWEGSSGLNDVPKFPKAGGFPLARLGETLKIRILPNLIFRERVFEIGMQWNKRDNDGR